MNLELDFFLFCFVFVPGNGKKLIDLFWCIEQKKKEEEKAKEKELNDLFKIAVSQPKVPVGMCSFNKFCLWFHLRFGVCVEALALN